ncbi:protein-export chaperone SecB [Enterococcus sp. BWR-S5]|uniref:protein-export chaperone SecB n=1 Tax=Enterococcus sp. BWR-S5 TaxID=2787714 RepID=UPI00192184DF|nr:protein-export chaperone SecB [Enterococcus sp. BWR-S5]MBL1225355.1 protein-export chaperone SecB [Enterococcus sp. BWR-S5]
MASPIEFQGYRIEKIEYDHKMDGEDTSITSNYFDPQVELRFDEDFKEGLVILSVTLNEKDERHFFLQLAGFFVVTSEEVDQEQAKELLALNGTTILMPYARSIISMITSLDSPRALVMPTVNIHELFSS